VDTSTDFRINLVHTFSTPLKLQQNSLSLTGIEYKSLEQRIPNSRVRARLYNVRFR
jgi:hypothetical protein